ncbi:MAG: hypothetical protein CM15mP45_05320 [Deltaproteobacteria bacterium]|nr:MAG: hypothetical protein CM15mP45_05320 [Deltaproteobacteria bacterium]
MTQSGKLPAQGPSRLLYQGVKDFPGQEPREETSLQDQ